MIKEFDFYKENDLYCVFIGDECSSGYTIKKDTKEELLDSIKEYIEENVEFEDD